MNIAILNDLHFGVSEGAARKCEYAKFFLKRAVRRLNQLIRPDIVLVLGDLLNDGESPDAVERLHALRKVLDTLDAPYLAIPGNHDPAPDDFYAVFARPADMVDSGGVRFLPFLDAACPGYNARRNLARQILARVEALHTNRQADSASKQYEGVDDEDIG